MYYEVEAVTVTAAVNASGANRTITPTDSELSTNGHQVALTAGGNTVITVQVTAEGGNTPQDYTITVSRRDAASVEARLTDLTLTPLGGNDELSPDFNAHRVRYTASVDHTDGFVTVAATPAGNATVAYSPARDAIRETAGHQVELTAGQTRTITITVTSPDERYTRDYTIEVTRADAPSTDATLSQLVADGGNPLNQTFSPYETLYTAFVDHGTSFFTVNPVANAATEGATITYSSLDSQPDTDGHQFRPGTTLTITVTAPDGRTTKRYTIRVTEAGPPATDATLSDPEPFLRGRSPRSLTRR